MTKPFPVEQTLLDHVKPGHICLVHAAVKKYHDNLEDNWQGKSKPEWYVTNIAKTKRVLEILNLRVGRIDAMQSEGR